jgi:hypothetical protein
MTLIIQKPTGAKLNLAQTYVGIDDPDAAVYVAAVEAADGQSLETATKVAIHSFVKGCKADGIWPAIKASCILAGARTLTGALVPLVKQPADSAPARFGTEGVGGWSYERKTGLQGNGTDNYINSNRANNADPRDNSHIATRVSNQVTGVIMAGGDIGSTGRNYIDDTGVNGRFDCRTIGAAVLAARINANTLAGISRSSSTSFNYRLNGSTITQSTTSNLPDSVNTFIYARSSGGAVQNFASRRLAFYSIGESLDLALLDARITDLINAIGAAIP